MSDVGTKSKSGETAVHRDLVLPPEGTVSGRVTASASMPSSHADLGARTDIGDPDGAERPLPGSPDCLTYADLGRGRVKTPV